MPGMAATQQWRDTARMPADDSLKRLGGGRWETRDGRFAIEPQSGTWVVVDNDQTDDLGLPLVRGPFGSLTAAREAIESVRSTGPAESPLADRIRQAKAAAPPKPKPPAPAAALKQHEGADPKAGASARPAKSGPSRKSPPAPPAPPEPPTPPEPAPEPKWLVDLKPADRRRARDLVERLEKVGISDALEVARAEVARNEPALARLALQRNLLKVIDSTKSPGDAVRAAVKVVLGGRDGALDVRWRLVDDQGRPLVDLELPD
jgi:hypothetical protein